MIRDDSDKMIIFVQNPLSVQIALLVVDSIKFWLFFLPWIEL